ncbi:MAG: hypothetical protein ACYDAC_01105 [Candidatus Dormibacteria bacterium]
MFRRHRDQPEVVAAPGREACREPGCGRHDGTRCSYVDKRNRHCATTWCGEHARLVDGRSYCRRHASTLLALGREENVAGLPDLENRAPSLVGHVGDDLDGFVRELFARQAPPACRIVTDPVRLVLTPGGRTRRWAKTWKLADHRGIVSRVSIEVDEAEDPRVAARVDTELIGSGVPPWIEHRRRGETVDVVTAERERRGFAASMARSIELVLTHQEALPRY